MPGAAQKSRQPAASQSSGARRGTALICGRRKGAGGICSPVTPLVLPGHGQKYARFSRMQDPGYYLTRRRQQTGLAGVGTEAGPEGRAGATVQAGQ